MTRNAYARIAGFTFLFYIAVGIATMLLSNAATNGADLAARLTRVAQHTTMLRAAILLNTLAAFSAFVLGTSLYAITRDENHEVATLGLLCRAGEGVLGIFPV